MALFGGKKKMPDYIIEESIPRFSGIDTPTIAYVKCDFLNIDGNYIISRTLHSDWDDELQLRGDDSSPYSDYDIVLVSDNQYKILCERKSGRLSTHAIDECGGMLTTYRHSMFNGNTWVTQEGFNKHFTVRTLSNDFKIEQFVNRKFDDTKLVKGGLYKITANGHVDYGILKTVDVTKLEFTVPDPDEHHFAYTCEIDWIVDGTVSLEYIQL